MVFYDFEVFKHDWLVVCMDTDDRTTSVIHNDVDGLWKFYSDHRCTIWCGYNSRHYDQYILKAILSMGEDDETAVEIAKEMNDWIIKERQEPWRWRYAAPARKIVFSNYDVMPTPPVGLKTLEGFMGSNIKETDVPFGIDRPLTDEELEMTIRYCKHDVEETMKVFLYKKADFDAQFGIVKAFELPITCIGDTEARITSKVLGCVRQDFDDEFDFTFLTCIRLEKYKYVQEWFAKVRDDFKDMLQRNREAAAEGHRAASEQMLVSGFYKQSFNTVVAGVPHSFGFGGLHGAPDHPVHYDGYILHVDVGSYYPSMLIAWDLVTRAATNDNYAEIYKTRMALKKAGKKKEQAPYKKLLNSLSGAMKDRTNPAYDPLMNNIMCINGQLMLLDLIEHLEAVPGFELIQSNTDGLIISIPDTDEAFNQVDDICWEWESRCSTDKCSILLALDQIKEIYQKDVNNYLWIEDDGKMERKGAYVKELSPTDYDLPILNTALVEYMAHKVPVETTINNCDDLIQFQKIVKLSDKYGWVEREYGNPHEVRKYTRSGKPAGKKLEYDTSEKYHYKAFRVFASTDPQAGRILKCKKTAAGDKKDKFGNTPDKCFIWNDSVLGTKCPPELDKQWYIDFAKKRLEDFGIYVERE